jgi:SAM-dependent methyltransferase
MKVILIIPSAGWSATDGDVHAESVLTLNEGRVEIEEGEFDRLMAEGLNLDVEAYWGAGFLSCRFIAAKPSWSYEALARPILADAESALDMGTGDGGVLASLAPLPKLMVAYEDWWPTVPAAQATLTPLGVHLVVALGSVDNVPEPDAPERPSLPFRSEAFDVVLNRHEAFDPLEIHRIIKRHGRFLTEQVGSDEAASIRTLLGLEVDHRNWSAAVAVGQLEAHGWVIEDVREERPSMSFTDVGALIGYIRSIPWAFEDLDWTSIRPRLQRLHEQSQSTPIVALAHRFLLMASP